MNQQSVISGPEVKFEWPEEFRGLDLEKILLRIKGLLDQLEDGVDKLKTELDRRNKREGQIN